MYTRPNKTLHILLALLLVVTLGACGPKDEPDPAPAEEVAGNGTDSGEPAELPSPYAVTDTVMIEWWHTLNAQYDETVREIIAGFHESQDLITVRAIYQGSNSDMNEKLLAAQAAGNTPALAVAGLQMMGEYGASGMAEVLDPYIESDQYDTPDIAEGYLASGQYGEQQVALPFLAATQVLYYNKDMAEEDEIALPTRWSDLDGFLEEATTSYRKALGIAGWDYWYYEPFFLSAGLEIVKEDGDTDLKGTAARGIVQQLRNWKDEGYVDWFYGTGASTNIRQGFADEDYFAVIHSSSLYDLYVESCEFEVGMWYLPGMERGVTTTGGNVLFIPADTRQNQKNAGWELMKYLVSEEASMTWAEETGYMPVRKSLLRGPELSAFLEDRPEYKTVLDRMDSIQARNVTEDYTAVSEIWREALTRVLAQEADLDEAVTEALDSIEESLGDSAQ